MSIKGADVSDGSMDLTEFELVGYTSGLSAGLAEALADLDDTELMTVARGGYAAVPVGRAHPDATVVEHRMATAEGVAILDVRLPPGLAPLRHRGNRPEVVGLRLAAVRIGVVRRLLDQALAAPGDPMPVPPCCLTVRADILSALGSLRRDLTGMAGHPSRKTVVDVHAHLTHLGRQVAVLVASDGRHTDHPARALFIAELVADTWVGA
jgi:hypothetical protein